MSFRERVAAMEQAVKKAQGIGGTNCMTTTIILAVVIPVAIFAVLYLWSPGIIKDDDEFSWKKLLLWVFGLSIVGYSGLFGYQYYTGTGICAF
jgi:uncharacterized membrane protein